MGEHVGIDINSVMSKITMPWNGSIVNGKINSARVNYDSTAKNLSVAFISYVNGIQVMRYIDYSVNVNDYLRDRVIAGFSAATGDNIAALHRINSWSFNSTSQLVDIEAPHPFSPLPKSGKGKNIGIAVGIGVGGFLFLVGGIVVIWFILCKKRNAGENSDEKDAMVCDLIDDEFGSGTPPRKFSYGELARATSEFLEEEKLGEGGFGGV